MKKADAILKKNTDAVLTALGFNDIAEVDKSAVMEDLTHHFMKIIMETVAVNLPDELVEPFRAAMALEPDARDEKIMEITAQVPGLSEKLETAMEAEFMAMRAAKDQIDKP